MCAGRSIQITFVGGCADAANGSVLSRFATDRGEQALEVLLAGTTRTEVGDNAWEPLSGGRGIGNDQIDIHVQKPHCLFAANVLRICAQETVQRGPAIHRLGVRRGRGVQVPACNQRGPQLSSGIE